MRPRAAQAVLALLSRGSAAASLAILASRGLTLVARLGLLVFLARDLGVEALGAFGLLSAATLMAPVVAGLGLNFQTNREIITLPLAAAARLIRDRLAFTLLILTGLGAVAASAWLLLGGAWPEHALMFAAIVVLETIAFDISLSLVSLRRPLLANALAFIRSALWIFPFVAVALVAPAFRTFGWLMSAWLAGLLLMFVVLGLALRDWPWADLLRSAPDVRGMAARARRNARVYVSDLSLLGSAYLDRFLVGAFLGLAHTGVYSFYLSLGSAVQSLALTSLIQPALPQLVDAREAGEASWRRAMRRLALVSAAAHLTLGLCAGLALALVLPFVGRPELSGAAGLFAVLLLAAGVRLWSDLASLGLYSLQRDDQWVNANLLSCLASIGLTLIGLAAGGVWGAAAANLAAAIVHLLIRLRLLARTTWPGGETQTSSSSSSGARP